MNIPKCKGARDLMPQDMAEFRRIEEAFRTSCTAWGYQEIRTPVLEYLHLFTSAGTLTPDMLSRVYTFLDWDGWSGERVVLRPDGTIPVARLYVENLSNQPAARLFYTENMFSFEGSGQESRERWQCGVELIGGTEPEGDAELIMLALEILRKLNTDSVKVKLSHVGLFKALLKELGYADEERDPRLRQILSGDTSILKRKRIEGQSPEVQNFLGLLLDLKGTSPGFLENLRSILPESLSTLKPHIDDLAQVAELLDGIGQEYEVALAFGEGFEYYTGIVFQFSSEETVLGNGGRYNELIPLVGGPDIPASGFALFINRLAVISGTNEPSMEERILLRRKNIEAKGMEYAFEIAGKLRNLGHIVEMDMGTEKPGGHRWVVSVGKKDQKAELSLIDASNGDEKAGLTEKQLLESLGAGK